MTREEGEKVVVIGGVHTGKIATVIKVAEKTATLKIDGSKTGNIPFKELFGVGDMVQSISGKYEDQIGKIHSIADERFKMEIEGQATDDLKPDTIAAPEEESTTAKEDMNKDTKQNEGEAEESKSVTARQKDEKVVVIGGEYTGKIATIVKVAEKTATLKVDGKETGNIPFNELFGVGDMVRSISGKYKGKSGKIHSIAAERLKMEIEGTVTGDLKPDTIAAA